MAGHRRGPGRIPEKPKNFKGTIGQLFRYLGRYRLGLALVLVLALASTAFGIVGPKILSTATTELATGLGRKLSGLGGIDFGKIGKILLTVLALYLVSAACSFFQSWILAGITQKLAYRLRGEISSKIHHMPMRYFERNTVGDVLSRITNDVDTMSSGMAQSATQLVTNVTLLIGVLVMMLRISWLMTLIALIMLPVTGVLTSRIVKRSQRYFVAQQKNLGDINGKVEETYAGHNVVCAFNREGATQKEFDAINARLYRSAWKSQFLSGLMSPVTTFVSKLGYVCVVVLGGSLAAHGTITIGDIQAFISYMSSFTQPITQLAQISTQLQTMAAAAERVFAFLAEPESRPTLPCPPGGPYPRRRVVPARALRLRSRAAGHPRLELRRAGGQDRRHRRPDRCRQDHDGQAAHALLRCGRRRHPRRRARRARLCARRPAARLRHGAAGHVAL